MVTRSALDSGVAPEGYDIDCLVDPDLPISDFEGGDSFLENRIGYVPGSVHFEFVPEVPSELSE